MLLGLRSEGLDLVACLHSPKPPSVSHTRPRQCMLHTSLFRHKCMFQTKYLCTNTVRTLGGALALKPRSVYRSTREYDEEDAGTDNATAGRISALPGVHTYQASMCTNTTHMSSPLYALHPDLTTPHHHPSSPPLTTTPHHHPSSPTLITNPHHLPSSLLIHHRPKTPRASKCVHHKRTFAPCVHASYSMHAHHIICLLQ